MPRHPMSEKAPYPNAPITEAVLDIRVQLPPDVGTPELLKAHEGEEAAYPLRETMVIMQVSHGPDGTHSRQHEGGYRFKSTDGLNIYQARLDGFTMNRLAPYEHWEKFRTEARRLWNVYREHTRPARVTRLAVRYLNRIDMPLPMNDFDEYLRTLPLVSPDVPQALGGFFMQLTIPLDAINSLAIINENMTEPARPNVASVVLDLEISRLADVPQDEAGMWEFIEELRTWKNRLFEGSITDKARELFQ